MLVGRLVYPPDNGLHEAICNAVSAGVTVVVAAGPNSGSRRDVKSVAPAAYDEVITVSAMVNTDGMPGGQGGALGCGPKNVDSDDTILNPSNFGHDVDLTAPGCQITTTAPGGGQQSRSGTSFAAPFVTGAAVLYKLVRPLASPDEVARALVNSSERQWNPHTGT
jgi:subtilisin